jgi:hypothetical protein
MNLSLKSCIAMIFLTLCSNVFAADNANENDNSTSKQWACETNASSASNDTEKATDKKMENAKSAKSAFDYAFKHCRDCTKITCKSE